MGQNTSEISGFVYSKSDNSPLIGARVSSKSLKKGTTTDLNGKFSLQVGPDRLLEISYVGFNKEIVNVKGKKSVNIYLSESSNSLSEMVVVGYATVKKSDLTGSISSIDEKSIKRTISTTLDQAIQGKAAGVLVTQNSGEPGGGISIQIRGVNTIGSSNEPLYVVDGIPIDGSSKSSNSQNALSTINPSDIVSMEILKDASATAIYGSRGANGVVLIQTKRGVSGKTQVTYDGYLSYQQIPYKFDLMNLQEYAGLMNIKNEITGWGGREEFLDPSILGDGTNWQNELFRVAPMQNHQLNVNGGNEKTRFSISAGYLSQEGIALGSDFNRISTRINFDTEAAKWLKFGMSLNASQVTQNTSFSDNGLIQNILRNSPAVPARMLDGTYGGSSAEDAIEGTSTNPLALALITENRNKKNQLLGNIYAEILFNKHLILRNEVGGNIDFNQTYYFRPTYAFGVNINNQNSSSRGVNSGQYWIIKNYLTYLNTFNDIHSVSAMVGHEAQRNDWENLGGSRNTFFINDLHNLSLGDATTASNYNQSGFNSIESYFSRLNYILKERYLFTATMRYDGSTRFGLTKKWASFPSFAFAWRINNEPFVKSIKAVSNAKLRLGWGQVGNQNFADGAYTSYLNTNLTQFGPGVLQANIPNPNVQWEATESYNAGLDIGLIKGRIELVVDAYIKKTDQLLMQPSMPGYVGTGWGSGGVDPQWLNIGGIRNTGIEVTLNTVNIDKNGFYWKTGLMYSKNKNIVTKLNSDDEPIYGYHNNAIVTRSVVGEPIGQLYGYVCEGMFTDKESFYNPDGTIVALPEQNGQKIVISPGSVWVGDYKWKDLNGDGLINQNDRAIIGNPFPAFQFGINNYFSYKGFDLNVFFNGVYGNKIYNYLRSSMSDPANNGIMLKSILGFAQIEKLNPNGTFTDLDNVRVVNPNNEVSRLVLVNQNSNQRFSSRFVEDGSYIRLKNVSLGYNFSPQLLKILQISTLRVHSSIQNLFTISKYKGLDPEIGSIKQNMLTTGIDDGRYPSQRIYTFGLTATF